MKNSDFKKHKGELLDYVVRKKGIKIKALAAEAGFDRSTYYNHIKDANLPYPVISKYGEVLNYDFSKEYPEIPANTTYEAKEITTFEEMEKDRNYWRKRFLDLAEKVAENYTNDKRK